MLTWVFRGVLAGTNPRIHGFLCVAEMPCSLSCRNDGSHDGGQEDSSLGKPVVQSRGGDAGSKVQSVSYLLQAAFAKGSPKDLSSDENCLAL